MSDALETYLRGVAEIRAIGSGMAGTSFYPPLANLLNEIGNCSAGAIAPADQRRPQNV